MSAQRRRFPHGGNTQRECGRVQGQLFACCLHPGRGQGDKTYKGVHVLTGDEYLDATRFEDSVSRGAHPIDIHVANGEKQNITFLKEPAYVPYRSLIADDFPNLIVAGRCISADKTAFASIRVQASCMDMGQAAGVAAAQCSSAGKDVQEVNIQALTSRLREMGACI